MAYMHNALSQTYCVAAAIAASDLYLGVLHHNMVSHLHYRDERQAALSQYRHRRHYCNLRNAAINTRIRGMQGSVLAWFTNLSTLKQLCRKRGTRTYRENLPKPRRHVVTKQFPHSQQHEPASDPRDERHHRARNFPLDSPNSFPKLPFLDRTI